jgi:hypothetical protein
MSIRKRILGGGAALGLLISGWGLTHAPVAHAADGCTPGPTTLCYNISGTKWTSIVVVNRNTGHGTGAAIVCGQGQGVYLLTAVNASTYTSHQIGTVKPATCP